MHKPADEEIKKYTIDRRQFMDFRESTLTNGMRIIDAYNSSGLHFTLLPDRGMDIWTASYNGKSLTWISQGSPFPPDFGQSWIQQFNGGLMTTCGLTHAGPPETDPDTGEQRGIHGRYSRLRAGTVALHWLDQDQLALSATIAQQRLFGEQLSLVREVRMTLGVPQITITDEITNLSDQPAPIMVLYHINLGYPLIREGTTWHSPDTAIYPRDAVASAGLSTANYYDAPQDNYAEQVFFHHVNYETRDKRPLTCAAVTNDDFGLFVEWDAAKMPYLTQWKNTRTGIYVNGLEPGNCIPEGQNAARAGGRLQILQPGESQSLGVKFHVLDGADAIHKTYATIEQTRENGKPAAAHHLSDYPSGE